MDPIEASAVVPRLRFRQENEVKQNYSARIPAVEWKRHEEAVRYMHEQRKTRREMLEVLDKEYEFRPSMPQLNAYMKKRKLRVYGGGNADGNGEPKEVAEDEVLPVADAVAGADEFSRSTSLPAGQKADSLGLQCTENLEQYLTARDAERLDLRSEDQDRVTRSPERLAQTPIAIPAENVHDLSSLNLDSVSPDEVETSTKTTPLTPDITSVQSNSESELKEKIAGWFVEEYSTRQIASSEATSDVMRNTVNQLEQSHSVGSNQYIAPGAASVYTFRSHPSDGGSLRAFRHFAAEVDRNKQLQRKDSQHSLRTPTIMSEDSWDFGLVTGMPSGYPSQSGIKPVREMKDADWEAYRSIFVNLYIDKGMTLLAVSNHMREYYGFRQRCVL